MAVHRTDHTDHMSGVHNRYRSARSIGQPLVIGPNEGIFSSCATHGTPRRCCSLQYTLATGLKETKYLEEFRCALTIGQRYPKYLEEVHIASRRAAAVAKTMDRCCVDTRAGD